MLYTTLNDPYQKGMKVLKRATKLISAFPMKKNENLSELLGQETITIEGGMTEPYKTMNGLERFLS